MNCHSCDVEFAAEEAYAQLNVYPETSAYLFCASCWRENLKGKYQDDWTAMLHKAISETLETFLNEKEHSPTPS